MNSYELPLKIVRNACWLDRVSKHLAQEDPVMPRLGLAEEQATCVTCKAAATHWPPVADHNMHENELALDHLQLKAEISQTLSRAS